MTTLILQSVGAAVGGTIGGPVGAMIGRAAGTLAGSAIDQEIFGGRISRHGARLSDMPGLASTEGAPVPRLYGRARLGGQLIWATRFQETVETQSSGGKGLGGPPDIDQSTYIYHCNIAIGLCEGEIAFVRRIWADGKLLDWSNLTVRVYRGDEAQEPDPLILAKEGARSAPAYRGLAYIVFEQFPLRDYGNRIPQFSFEVIRPLGQVRTSVRAINLIPGAGEFVYDPDPVTSLRPDGVTEHLNRHQVQSMTDFEDSLDQLLALCPNLAHVQLVVTWFGNDLRLGECKITPRVETNTRTTSETEWICAGLDRASAESVSRVDDRPAYGGTPSDASVLRAVRALRARGLSVTIYPFVMMDIAADNRLPDPWTDQSFQAAYPWRGRITTSRAPGRVGSTDKSARVDSECNTFFGSTKIQDLSRRGDTVFSASDEWSYRRFVFHYARLLAAESISGFVIGSEMRGITRLRNAEESFPAITHLAAIAADIRSVLPASVEMLYAADWTEYGSYVTPEGDVRFPLDALFAHPAISAVAIDAYWPLSDWRDGPLHKDAALAPSVYDRDYLVSRFGAGENYDWYYALGEGAVAPASYASTGTDWNNISAAQAGPRLYDGDVNAEIFGNFKGTITADLGQERHVRHIAIAPIPSSLGWGARYAADLAIDVSRDGAAWSRIGVSPTGLAEGRMTLIGIGASARFVRLSPAAVRLSGGEEWIGLSEFRILVGSDRDAQIRTPITDGAHDEAWMYRSKDLVNWWSRAHHERRNGVRASTPTAWIPKSKPVYLTEFGCPAVDRGSNTPNVFPDPKSSENALPHFSRGSRDDLIVMRTLEAVYRRFDPASSDFNDVHNPLSPVYGGRMLDPSRIALWAWDARPFPAFPDYVQTWSDGSSYETGHWLNGRFESVALDDVIARIIRDFDLPKPVIALDHSLDGFVIEQPMSARAALELLAGIFGFSCSASGGIMYVIGRDHGRSIALSDHDLVPMNSGTLVDVIRAQENELPREIRLGFSDADRLYRAASVNSRRMAGGAKGSVQRDAPVVLRMAEAKKLADLALFDVWGQRETLKFRVRPGLRNLEPGDRVSLAAIGYRGEVLITRIVDGMHRDIEACSISPGLADLAAPVLMPTRAHDAPQFAGLPEAILLTLPALGTSASSVMTLGARTLPWSGPLTVWRSVSGSAFSVFDIIRRPARLGRSTAPFAAGPVWMWDDGNGLEVDMAGPALSSRSDAEALSAKPALGIQGQDLKWEIVSYAQVDLIGVNRYRYSRLLRGLCGTEHLANRIYPVGSRVIVLDDTLLSLATGSNHLGETWAWRIVPQGADVSDPRSLELIGSIDGLALTPFSPVHAQARRVTDGIAISWIRRARENGDSWGVAEIALDEDDERYAIDIMHNGQIKRTLHTDTHQCLYAADQELTDFGATQTEITLSICQLSRSVGRGTPLSTVLKIR